MSGKLARAILIIFFSLLVAWAIWLAFTVQGSFRVIGKAQVKLAEQDVKMLRDALDALWYTYNLDEEQGKTYTTESYDVFKNKITDLLTEQFGELPSALPTGKNFTDFYYTGSDTSYTIKVKAKDKRKTLVNATPYKVWHE